MSQRFPPIFAAHLGIAFRNEFADMAGPSRYERPASQSDFIQGNVANDRLPPDCAGCKEYLDGSPICCLERDA